MQYGGVWLITGKLIENAVYNLQFSSIGSFLHVQGEFLNYSSYPLAAASSKESTINAIIMFQARRAQGGQRSRKQKFENGVGLRLAERFIFMI
jgi:hypothetical protein